MSGIPCHYDIFVISEQPTQSDIVNYAALRLLALRTDPDCFSSTHQRESAFTETQWRSRISSQHGGDRVVIIASSVADADADADAVASSSSRDDDSNGRQYDGIRQGPQEDWVGTLTILAPDALLPLAFTPPKLEGTIGHENASVYALFAMWVHPTHRGRGVGKKLIDAGFAWVRKNIDASASAMTSQTPPVKVVALRVRPDNSSAKALYTKMRFREIQDVDVDASECIWMVAEVTVGDP